MKNTYVIGQITIKDVEKWEQYRDQVPSTLKTWNAEIMFRGKLKSVLSGNHSHSDTVVIRFPNIEQAILWFESPQYQALIPLRDEAADVDLLAFEE
ncbi:MAG: DUF1330 domain-containing protein [Gammaproteobacteria bacterium]